MTERKHTPTPWRVGRGPNGEVEIWGRTSMNASPIVASMEHGPRELNALTIVRAVNGIALASPPAMGEDVAEFVRRLGNGLNPRNGSINVSVPAFQLYMEMQLRALLSRIEAAGGEEPVAWSYEIAKSIRYSDNEGDNWQLCLSREKPNAGKYTRNVIPLFAAPLPSPQDQS